MLKPSESLASGTPPTLEAREAMRAALRSRLCSAADAQGIGCEPPSIADHTLLQPIGRGAYGEVWLGRNALGTLRAVKIVYRARFEDDRPYEREFRGILKFEPVSRSHEGLTHVLHVGRNDESGCFYYVMELADDLNAGQQEGCANAYSPRTLCTESARGQRLRATEIAQLVLRLADALNHLHSRGLIHRDIKPSNVIYVEGQPKLADIGLVTTVGSSRTFVGTEGFIPPEGPGSVQADIYALGKVLYELVTGLDRMEFPQLPPNAHLMPDRDVLLELNEIMTRACAPDPQQRYASALELQADLNLFLSGRSLRRARSIERHLARFKSFSYGACAFVLIALAALFFSKREEHHARERAQVADESAQKEAALRHRAEAAEMDARQQLYTALLGQARATVRSGELGHRVQALDALRRAAAISNSVELRREAFAALALPDLRFQRQLVTPAETTLVQLDPTFERIAVCSDAGPVEIRSFANYELLYSFPASRRLPAHYAAWSDDGRFLAIKRDYDVDGLRASVEVWDTINGKQVLLVEDALWGLVSFHPHKPLIMAARHNGPVVLLDLADGGELAHYFPEGRLISLKYSPDGTKIAFASDVNGRGLIRTYDTASGLPLLSKPLLRRLSCISWHPDGSSIAAGADDNSLHLINSETGESQVLGRHKAQIVLAAFSPDGAYLISGGWEREMICWSLHAMRRAFKIPLGSFRLQFSKNGLQCAVIALSGVSLYSFEGPRNHREFAENLGTGLKFASFSPDGRWLAASSLDRLGLWDLSNRAPGALSNEGADVRSFFTLDGLQLFGSRSDNDCLRWQIIPASRRIVHPDSSLCPSQSLQDLLRYA